MAGVIGGGGVFEGSAITIAGVLAGSGAPPRRFVLCFRAFRLCPGHFYLVLPAFTVPSAPVIARCSCFGSRGRLVRRDPRDRDGGSR